MVRFDWLCDKFIWSGFWFGLASGLQVLKFGFNTVFFGYADGIFSPYLFSFCFVLVCGPCVSESQVEELAYEVWLMLGFFCWCSRVEGLDTELLGLKGFGALAGFCLQ